MTANSVTEIERACEFCGLPLPAGSGRGRKRVLHDQCSQVSRSLSFVIKSLDSLEMTAKSSSRVRSSLFVLVNGSLQLERNKLGQFLSPTDTAKKTDQT